MSDSAAAYSGGIDVLINRAPAVSTGKTSGVRDGQRSEPRRDAFSNHLNRANDQQRAQANRQANKPDDTKPARNETRTEAVDATDTRAEPARKPLAEPVKESHRTPTSEAPEESTDVPKAPAVVASSSSGERSEHAVAQALVWGLHGQVNEQSPQAPVAKNPENTATVELMEPVVEAMDTPPDLVTPESEETPEVDVVESTGNTDAATPQLAGLATVAAGVASAVDTQEPKAGDARLPGTEQPTVTRVGETVSPSTLANRFRQLSADTGRSPEELNARIEPVAPETRKGASQVVSEATGKAVAASLTANSAVLAGTKPLTPLSPSATDTAELTDGALDADENSLILGKLIPDGKGKTTAHAQDKELSQEILKEKLHLEKGQVGRAVQENLANLAQTESRATPSPSQTIDTSLPGASVATLAGAPVVRMDSTATTGVNAPLNVPLTTAAASDSLSSNIRWMVREGVQNANVNVSPSGMGPISVKIGIDKDQMNVSIVALQGNTREALEHMLPRLREHLSLQGYETVRVDISDGRSEQSRGNAADQHSQGEQHMPSDQAEDALAGNLADNNEREADASGADQNTSGERVLSESERILVEQLQSVSGGKNASDIPLQHGYDLYV